MTRALERLRKSWQTPPSDFRPLALWFLNGELHEAELGRQIGELVDKGLKGAVLHARPGLQTPYLGERWWDAVSYSVRKGAEAGFETWIHDEYAQPSGSAGPPGGPVGQSASAVLEAGPEHRGKSLVHRVYEIEGPTQVPLEGRYPAGDPLVRIAARVDERGILDPESFTDISRASSWNCPAGSWRIVGFAIAASDEQIDYLRTDTVRLFIKTVYQAYAERYGADLGKTIPGFLFAGPHLLSNPMPWTDSLPRRFKALKGYALTEKLPMLLFRAGPETAKVRCDFYEVLATQYEEAWFKQIAAWCKRYRVAWAGYTEERVAFLPGRQGEYFRGMRHVAMPGADGRMFRFARPRTVQPTEIKPAVSVGAMLRSRRVLAEAFGGAGWGVTLDDVRLGAGLLAALGVDQVLLHGFHYTLDGADAADDWPGSYSFQNPWWEHFGLVTDYIARLSAFVNQTRAATRVGLLYPLTSVCANTAAGRPNPRAREIAATFERLLDGLFERRVDAHVVDETFVSDARLRRGVLTMGHVAVQTLVLPPSPVLRRATLRRLAAFVESGGRLIIAGEWPSASSDAGSGDHAVAQATSKLFGPASQRKRGLKIGRGHAFALDETKASLLDDVTALTRAAPRTASKSTGVVVVPRSFSGGDAFVVVNTAGRKQSVTIEAPAKGAAEIWDPETGSMEPAPVRAARRKRSVQLELPPHGTRAIVFDESARATVATRSSRREPRVRRVSLKSDWQFVLESGTVARQGSVRKLELPVMRFQTFALGAGRLERLRDPEFDDSDWQVRWLTRPTAEAVGNWRASWITGVRKPSGWVVVPTSDRHSRLRFTKTLTVTEPPIKAWATFAAVDRATVYMNGTALGETDDWTNPVTYNVMPYLRLGENVIVADVEAGPDSPLSFLLEAQVDLRSGESIVVVSDDSWKVEGPRSEFWTGRGYEQEVPIVTWERGKPPTAPWGHIPMLSESVRFPRTLMYRQNLPVGCVGIGLPSIKGNHRVYVDVRERTPDIYGTYNITTGRMLSVEIEARDFSNGILAPLELYTRPTTIQPAPWSDLGYGWYSGVAIYERSFELTAAQAESRVVLDLGKVCFHANVTVNNRPIGTRVWPPYTFDLTGVVQQGSNTVRVRVSNLLANRMRWNRDESRMSTAWHRYWHEDNIEPEALSAGLLGPATVRIG